MAKLAHRRDQRRRVVLLDRPQDLPLACQVVARQVAQHPEVEERDPIVGAEQVVAGVGIP